MAKNDVELVIRARNEASRAIDAIANALNQLTSAQASTGAGAQKMDGLLGELVKQFQALDAQTKGLQAFGKVAREMDAATAAVERLEKSVASAAAEQNRLSAAQANSANEVSRLKAVAGASKEAYDAEKARLDFLKTRVSKDSLAYQEQVQAVERTSAANKEANAAVATAERQQRQLTGALGEASSALTEQQAKLDAAKTQFNELRTAAQGAGAALGGIVAEQQAVSAASQKTAADLKAVGDAIARQQAASRTTTAAPSGAAAQATAEYRAQVQAVVDARAAFAAARDEASRLGQQIASTANPTNELRTAFVLAKEAAQGARQAYIDQAQALAQLRDQSTGGFAAIDALARRAASAAKDLKDLRSALNTGGAATPAESVPVGPAAQATAAYRAQVEAVNAARAAFATAREETSRLGKELATTTAPTAELRDAFLAAKEASKAAEQSYIDQAKALGQLRGQSGGGFKQVIDLSESLKQIPAQESAVQRLLRAIGLGNKAVSQSNTGARKGEVLFGLRPYELQNLSFQINDLITQVASGTPPSQAFAQQIGQIVQIFPRMGAVLVAVLPELIAVGIVLGVVAAAMGNVGDHAESVREFGGELAASADGAHHSAEALADAAHQLDVYGGSLKDARAAISEFVKAGLDDTQIERFGRSAQNMADIFGIKVPDAAGKMADAFTHGYEAVKKLDDQFNFLSAAERQHIKELFESGRAEEARTEAFRIFERQMDAGAEKTRGPWTTAIRNLTAAWDNFLTFLANNTVVSNMIQLLGDLAAAAKEVSENLPGAKPPPRVTGDPELDRELAQLDQLKRKRQELAKPTFGDRVRSAAGQAALSAVPVVGPILGAQAAANSGNELSRVDRQIATTQQHIADLRKKGAQAGQQASQAQLKADSDVTDALRDQLNSLKGVNDARRVAVAGQKAYDDALAKGASQAGADAARALGQQIEQTKVNKENEARSRAAASRAQALQNKLDSLEGSIATAENNLERKAAEGQTASLKERLDAIAAQAGKIKGDLARFQSLGGKDINGESISAFTARIDQNTKILQQQETLKFYSEQVNDLEKQRQDRLRAIADQYAAGNISAAEAFKQEADAGATLTKQLAELAATAEDFAKALPNAASDPKIQAFVDQMERLRKAPTTGTRTEAAKGGQDLLSAQERELNAIVSQRNDLVEVQNQLLDRGLITLDEWRKRVQGAYAETTPEIEKQVDATRRLLDALREQGAITQAVYDAWQARLQQTQADTVDLSTQVLSVRDANEMLANSGVQGMQNFLQAVANGAGVVGALGDALRQMFADLLIQIAELILKQELLNLLLQTGVGQKLAGGVNGIFDVAPIVTATTALSTSAAAVGASAAPLTGAAGALSASGAAIGASAAPLIGASAALDASAAAITSAAYILMAANAASAGVFHSGAVVGDTPSRTRMISPLAFLGARRMHSGGIVGLAADEVPTILQRGEEVLSRNDPRNVLNGAAGGGNDALAAALSQMKPSVKVINAIDSGDMMAAGFGTRKGEESFMNFIRTRSGAINQLLGR